MLETANPTDEPAQHAPQRAVRVLGPQREERFDRVTRAAARVFGVRCALVSVVEAEREWLKSKVGLTDTQTPREGSFAAQVVSHDEPLVVTDAAIDERFYEHPWVLGEPFTRFYAGVPLRTQDKRPLGVLAIMDRLPRELPDPDLAMLRDLGAWAEYELNRDPRTDPERESARRQKELLAHAAHKVRTPLTAILGFSDLLAGTDPNSATAAEYVQIIRNNAQRLNALLGELLEGDTPKRPL